MFSVQSLISAGFKYEGTEKEMSASAAMRGWVTKLHPVPFLAPIPFPVSVRSGRLVGTNASRPNFPPPILRVRDHAVNLSLSDSGSIHPIFMEDYVQPNGWHSLLPYWPSDTQASAWFERRTQALGLRAALTLKVMDGHSGSERKAALSRFAPGRIRFAKALAKMFARELSLKARKLMLSLQKSAR